MASWLDPAPISPIPRQWPDSKHELAYDGQAISIDFAIMQRGKAGSGPSGLMQIAGPKKGGSPTVPDLVNV